MTDRRSSSTRPSMSSSLAGATEDPNIASHSGRSHHQPPPHPGLAYGGSNWHTSPAMPAQQMQVLPQFSDPAAFQGHLSPPNDLSFYNLNISGHRHATPDSSSSFASDRSHVAQGHHGSPFPPSRQGSSSSSFSTEEHLRAELEHLRRKVRDLESECARNRAALETTSRAGHLAPHGSYHTPALPTPPTSSSFVSSWRARTDARKRLFCSFNRAGNSLCAWHDSRRERRAYPPRNAPPGYLNCGCTHDEALFEESLARHGVGSYHPGESVRMDPALRNPLLRLLKRRYGYKDGDFERDPTTGEWVEGEGAAVWEQQANSGSSSRSRPRQDAEHH